MTSYTQKLNAFTPTKTWTVTDSGLSWQDEDKDMKSGLLKWEDIRSVRLRFEPSRAETRRVAMHIYTPVQHTITNIHYAGIMDFNLQKEEFSAFVKAFHVAIPKDTTTTFYSGSTKAGYFGNVLVSVAILLFLLFLAPIMAITGIPGATSIFRIVLILFFFPLLIRFLIRNKPSTYTPGSLPEKML